LKVGLFELESTTKKPFGSRFNSIRESYAFFYVVFFLRVKE